MKIVVKLIPTWWRHPPKAKVFFDNSCLWQGEVINTQVLTFDVDIQDQVSSNISVELFDKKIDETQVNGDEIIKDQLLRIDQILIDQIDLGYLLFKGIYRPIYPKHMIDEATDKNLLLPTTLEKIDTLGFNGTWTISFDHPFHIWYLENLP
jgi:hypothetical protein